MEVLSFQLVAGIDSVYEAFFMIKYSQPMGAYVIGNLKHFFELFQNPKCLHSVVDQPHRVLRLGGRKVSQIKLTGCAHRVN